MEENKKQHKKHKFSAKKGLVRIIALILAVSMCLAASASLIFMLIYS